MQIFCKSNFFKEHEVFYTFKDNGMTYQENEETNELENIAFQLQSQGFVEFSKKSILGDRELILNQEENCLDRIYKELKRVPVKEKIIHYVKLLDQYHEEAFIKEFC